MKAREFLASIAVIFIPLSLPSLASEPKGEASSFNSEQLSHVRLVSQSLLRVRGERRNMVLKERGPEIEKIKEVQRLLKQAQSEASLLEVVRERPSSSKPDYILLSASDNKKANGFERAFSRAKAFVSGFESKKKERKEIKSLNKAISAMREAKKIVDSKSAPQWGFWGERDTKAEEKLDRIAALEGKMSDLTKKDVISSKEIGDLYEEVAGSEVHGRSKIDPTIYTITKHVK